MARTARRGRRDVTARRMQGDDRGRVVGIVASRVIERMGIERRVHP